MLLDSPIRGRTNLYGHAIGILMIEGHFPRPPGAIGNATTFPFPVLHRVVRGATGGQTVRRLPDLEPSSPEYRAAVNPWIEGAKALERDGVRAITTSCGFSALFQRELTEAVSVPVFATSLLLVPMISRMLKPNQRVGILTADGRMLSQRHLNEVGADPETVAIVGLEGSKEFEAMSFEDAEELDINCLQRDVVAVAQRLKETSPDIGAILLECSLLPPYATAIQVATRLPVFDFTHLVNLVQSSLVRRPFEGYM